jgi:hypothetical protein
MLPVVLAAKPTADPVGNLKKESVITPRINQLMDGIGRIINLTMNKVEAPCTTDEAPCIWITEEEYTRNGVILNTYCEKCFRYRDWSKDELKQGVSSD